ncbi:MAG TPA: phosphoglycerate dehydrogenase [Desulfomonilaceae bacterium]|nr:phosphoglycerate dehydrogenase [Desulfomonilaceae bacterium]
MTYRILVTDNVHEKGIELLRRRSNFRVDIENSLSAHDLQKVIGEYHGLVLRGATKVTADVLAAASRLKVIGRAGAGVDNVDVAEATRRGVVVMNVPGGNAVATAEHTIGLIMAAHRHIAQATLSMKSGKWEKKKFQGREITGRILGVIGLGKVGSLVAKLAVRGLKMEVLGYDPAIAPDVLAQLGVKPASLDAIFSRSDVVTVHTLLNEETRGLINKAAFSKMKDGVIIVNCARGGIVDETALLAGLESGRVSAAALDVFSVSPPGEHPLVMHPNVIATPHLGASTGEAQVNVAVGVIDQMIDFLEKGIITNAVNVPAIDPALSHKMWPYLDLARRLGQFIGGFASGVITDMQVIYTGEIASWDVKPVTNAAILGLLSSSEGSDVNFVNAAVTARNRGIRVSETTLEESGANGPVLEIRVGLATGPRLSVQGALIRRIGHEPRIIGIGNFVTEAVPAGPMLIVTNRDVPGMIAGISGALAADDINIGQMNLSRDRIGGSAMSIINIDASASEHTLNKIRSIQGILSVKQVVLDEPASSKPGSGIIS